MALDPVISKALAKAPLDRYATPGELVAAAKAAAADHHVRPRRLAASVGLLLLAALVGAGIALGIGSFVGDGRKTTTRTVGLVPAKPIFDPQQLLKLDRIDVDGEIEFADRAEVDDYVRASISMSPFAENLPETVAVPFRARRGSSVFVAKKAA